ncbi:MAG: lysoplasmalogenase [Gemmatimonadota bacterium]
MPEPVALYGILTLLAAGSAAAHIRAEYRGPRWVVYACKPLTTSLLLLLACSPGAAGDRYALAIVTGLTLSLAGDVFLMLPRDRFVAGLVSFLLAHVAYLIAFTAGVSFAGAPVVFVPYAAVGVVVLAILWRDLGRLRGPVTLYVVVIMAMASQAVARALALQTTAAILAAAGAALFVASDTILAFDRFRQRFRSARLLVLVTYVLAQWLIALSVAMA